MGWNELKTIFLPCIRLIYDVTGNGGGTALSGHLAFALLYPIVLSPSNTYPWMVRYQYPYGKAAKAFTTSKLTLPGMRTRGTLEYMSVIVMWYCSFMERWYIYIYQFTHRTHPHFIFTPLKAFLALCESYFSNKTWVGDRADALSQGNYKLLSDNLHSSLRWMDAAIMLANSTSTGFNEWTVTLITLKKNLLEYINKVQQQGQSGSGLSKDDVVKFFGTITQTLAGQLGNFNPFYKPVNWVLPFTTGRQVALLYEIKWINLFLQEYAHILYVPNYVGWWISAPKSVTLLQC